MTKTTSTISNNIEIKLKLTFEESFFGVTKKIKYNRIEVCPTCDTILEKIKDGMCQHCGAKRYVTNSFSTEVKIPAGASEEMVLNFKDKGHQKIWEWNLMGFAKKILTVGEFNYGYLIAKLEVGSHKDFSRNGDDLIAECLLTKSELNLGAIKGIRLLDKSIIKINIPPGTEEGKVFRIKEKGFPVLKDGTVGNLLIVVKTVF